jgi:extracellular factor (EF) 3-hydroxypalmitic acid methyl ester biosynthesis protein
MLARMSAAFNGNGNGNGHAHGVADLEHGQKKNGVARPVPPPQAQSVPPIHDDGKSVVTFLTPAGVSLRGMPVSLTQHAVVFELYNPGVTPQLSEVLDNFEITLQEGKIYSGWAVVRNVVDASTKIICEAALDEKQWTEVALAVGRNGRENLRTGFNHFVSEWQKSFLVGNEYKLVIADLQTFLSDLRLWLDQVEASIRAAPLAEQARLEIEAVDELRAPVITTLNHMFSRFEALADRIQPEQQAAHRAFGQRQLHPYLLCSPFIHRCYTKPMGFAGDYEMMNMIVRNRLEGSSLYAKFANQYLLDQIGPMAVRGRVDFLEGRIAEETGRVARLGRKAKIFCVACGPAWEAVNFIAAHPLAESAEFQLLDFSEETLNYTRNKIAEVKQKNGCRTEVTFIRNAVQNLLRGKKKEAEFDLIYCSGLYDYLNDSVCKSLNTHLYDQLKPGGLLVVGNFAPNLPVRNFIEHFLEWFLIYRNADEFIRLAPEQAAAENCVVRSEVTGTNIFLEARKPA